MVAENQTCRPKMSIEVVHKVICDFQLSDRCLNECVGWSEAQAIEDGGWERRPRGRHICPECIEKEAEDER